MTKGGTIIFSSFYSLTEAKRSEDLIDYTPYKESPILGISENGSSSTLSSSSELSQNLIVAVLVFDMLDRLGGALIFALVVF